MKVLKLLISLILCLSMVLLVCACAGDYSDGVLGGYDKYYPTHSGDGGGKPVTPDEDMKDETTTEKDDETGLPAGVITASAWNDNENYELWKSLFFEGQTSAENGKFVGLNEEWGLNSLNRIKVTAKIADDMVANATVICKDDEGNEVFKAKTDAAGVAYVFTDSETGTIDVFSGNCVVTAEYNDENRDISVELSEKQTKLNIIDLMLVIDATGSMGDEMEYLKNELADVINTITKNDSQLEINLAMLFYRDDGDREKFAYYDFVNVSTQEGLLLQKNNLSQQFATGGGDIEEAVDEAIELAVSKSWSEDSTTKIIFHLLDAPPHNKNVNKQRFVSAVNNAAKKGIRVCPIIASGAELLCEYLMREEAIYTGGTFVFITDDSGIGNSHHNPQVPSVTVEALNSLMVRLIKGYHLGVFEDPVDYRQEIK